MTRLQLFIRAVASGYVALGVNVAFTLASVPLALHYLSVAEFGLWALITQIAGYLTLIELGLAGSIYRHLIDHKDGKDPEAYASLLAAGGLLSLGQALLLAGLGWGVGRFTGRFFDIPPALETAFERLLVAQSLITASAVGLRIFSLPLMAHQRNDISNYIQICQLVLLFAVQWLAFTLGQGLYSLIWGGAASTVTSLSLGAIASARLRFLPPWREWTHLNVQSMRTLFAYGFDLFLYNIGRQLLSASQVVIISLTLGLQAAAVWSVATKPFMLATQIVNRLSDFASPVLSEMLVQQEPQLEARFRQLVSLTAASAVFVGVGLASINSDFVYLWTRGRVGWAPVNDWLMALILVLGGITNCHTCFVGLTKKMKGLRFIYLLEGVFFVALAWLLNKAYGLTGILIAMVVSNLLLSLNYGVHRSAAWFQQSLWQVGWEWIARPFVQLAVAAPVVATVWWTCRPLGLMVRLILCSAIAAVLGLAAFWRFGLDDAHRRLILSRRTV